VFTTADQNLIDASRGVQQGGALSQPPSQRTEAQQPEEQLERDQQPGETME
jgi:hypothetical protein